MPLQNDVYGFMRSAVLERGSNSMNTAMSSHVASTFSMPMMLTSTSGRVTHMRPLPSDSTTHTVPVSAMAKFTPDTAIFVVRNFWRR